MRESSVSMSYDVINWVFVLRFLRVDTCLPYFVNPTTVGAIALLQLKVECGHLGKILTGWSYLTKDKRTILRVILLSCYVRVVISVKYQNKSDDRQPGRTCPRGQHLLRTCSSSRCRSPAFQFVKIFFLFPQFQPPCHDNQDNDLP